MTHIASNRLTRRLAADRMAAHDPSMAPRNFPAPWSVVEIPGGFRVQDASVGARHLNRQRPLDLMDSPASPTPAPPPKGSVPRTWAPAWWAPDCFSDRIVASATVSKPCYDGHGVSVPRAPLSRCRRRSVSVDEYKPSHRRIAPIPPMLLQFQTFRACERSKGTNLSPHPLITIQDDRCLGRSCTR
jgi:hypothetical protein